MGGEASRESAVDDWVTAIDSFGGLLDLTDEQIEKNIRDFPYVMGKLKDC